MFIRKLPSPSMSMTVLTGCAACAPSAAGKPNPIAPSPPLVIQCARLVEVEVLRGPHLMLADAGGDDRVVELLALVQDLPQPLDGVLRQDGVVAIVKAQRLRSRASLRSGESIRRYRPPATRSAFGVLVKAS